MRLGFSYLRYKRKIRKAGKVFRRRLEQNGLPPQAARQLAEAYEESLSVRKLIRQFGGQGLPTGFFKMG